MSVSNYHNSSFFNTINLLTKKALRIVSDLRLAIILLLIIALFSISGTIIEQNQGLNYYQQNYPENPALFGFLTWQVLIKTGLNHVYTTWWYLSILLLFGISLIACTFRRQLPALKAVNLWTYYHEPKQFNKLAISAEIKTESLNKIQAQLSQRGYRVYQNDQSLYAQKGISGRIGPIIVHLGMIIVLLGAIWGAFTGFFAQEIIPSGETFTINNFIEAGKFSNLNVPQSFQVKVNNFHIDYTEQGSVDQFYSDLSIINKNGEELKHKTIFVNEPLRYQGITFYQTNWGIAGIKVKLNNSPIFSLPMVELKSENQGRIWGTWIPLKPDLSEGVSLIVKDLQGTMFIYDMQGKLIQATRVDMPFEVNGIKVNISELVGSTGLQIKSDPGVPIVYFGFALLMIGVVMSYISFSELWALQQDDRFFFGGKTNRAQVAFEKEFLQIIEQL
jgi:cytochrome c biogenesis protein